MKQQYSDTFRVLVADDDPIFVDLVSATLAADRIEVTAADNGADAMEQLVAGRFDAVLVDIMMPMIDGLRLIALIRATPGLRDLPILVITSLADEETRADSLQTGADDFLTKPLDWAVFRDRVSRLLTKAR